MKTIEKMLDLQKLDGSITTRTVLPDLSEIMMVMAHGAGTGISHPFFEDFQQKLGAAGIASFAFNFLYRENGERTPFRMTKPMSNWIEVWDHVRSNYDLPMFVSGKSYGGRVGSMVIDQLKDAKGLIFLGYPFHPPKNLEKLRTEHLYKIELPMLFLQGTRDDLSNPEIANGFVEAHEPAQIVWLEDGDHSWKPRKKSGFTQEDHMLSACKEIKKFCLEHSG